MLEIKKNLVSVSQLARDNSCPFEFPNLNFLIKERATGKLMAIGSKKGNLYALDGEALATFVAPRSGKTTEKIWHLRLGHPINKLLKILNSQSIINIRSWNKIPSVCVSCQMGKSCKLPFSLNNKVANIPLLKIHCDLWGPSLVSSSQGIRYYVIFVDDCTRFTWFYPIKNKSDFFEILSNFRN